MPFRGVAARRRVEKAKIVLYLAIVVSRTALRRFVGDQFATAMPTFLAAANAAVAEWFGVGGVEVAAAALRAFDTARRRFGFGRLHCRRLRWSSAKLTRVRFAGPATPPVPSSTAPW